MKYKVVAATPVRVRIGTLEKAELKTFKHGEEFETAPELAKDVVTLGYVRAVESARPAGRSAKATTKTDKAAEAEKR